MTQIPRPHSPFAVPVVPEAAPAPVDPPAARTAPGATDRNAQRTISNEIEAVAVAWLRHTGFTDEQIQAGALESHQSAGCEFDGNHMAWVCEDEDGNSLHPLMDAVMEAAEIANVAVEALDARARIAGADADKLTLDRVADELGCTRAQLDLWFARRVADERDRAREDLGVARARIGELEATVGRVRALTYASDDGSEYEHEHGIGDGHDECPACWAEDIRRALAEEARK